MKRMISITLVLLGLSFGAFLVPVSSQAPDKGKPVPSDSDARKETLQIFAMLRQTIDTKGLREKVKLKVALEHLSDMFAGKLPILVDKDAFMTQLGADAPDPYEEEVVLPEQPQKMRTETALRMILRQIGKGNATFVVRDGYVEITLVAFTTTPNFLYDPMIVTSYQKTPLNQVLQDLSDRTGFTIHLDPNVGGKQAEPISAMFNNCSLEDALTPITEMAGLKFVVLQRSIFVTTPENARVVEQEERLRREKREQSPVLRGGKRLEAAAEGEEAGEGLRMSLTCFSA